MNTMTKCWLAVLVTFLPFMAVAYDSSLGACSSTNPYKYGDTGPDGGIVFYLEGACSGMEAQPFDAVADRCAHGHIAATYDWADAITASAAYNITAITKTLACHITPNNPSNTSYCWHLPSATELSYLYEKKSVVGRLDAPTYWSSTFAGTTTSHDQNFYDGRTGIHANYNLFYVRAVRAFNYSP